MTTRNIVAIAAVTLTLGAVAPLAQQQTIDDIVAKNYASKGGREHWQSVRTMKISGSAWGQGTEVGLTIYSKRPNLGRQEVVVDVPGQGLFTMVNVFDGTKAWSSNPMFGTDEFQEVQGPEADMIRDQSDFDGALLDYRAKGHTVERVGTETVGGKQAHHLKVVRKGRPAQHFYIDAETGVELKITTEAGSGPATETEFSDYRLVDGVRMPFLIRITQGGAPLAELRVAAVEFNEPIDDAWFKGR